MGHQTLVWVSKFGVEEVDGQQGFVEVDSDDAETLIKDGLVQDPQVGALHLLEIESAPPAEEKPPVKKKTAPKRRSPTTKVVEEQELDTK